MESGSGMINWNETPLDEPAKKKDGVTSLSVVWSSGNEDKN